MLLLCRATLPALCGQFVTARALLCGSCASTPADHLLDMLTHVPWHGCMAMITFRCTAAIFEISSGCAMQYSMCDLRRGLQVHEANQLRTCGAAAVMLCCALLLE